MSLCPEQDCDYPAGTACARFPCPGRSLRGFPNHNSQPSYALWRQSIRIQVAGAYPEKFPGDARGTGPVAHHHLTALDGGTVAGAASPNMRGPDVFSTEVA